MHGESALRLASRSSTKLILVASAALGLEAASHGQTPETESTRTPAPITQEQKYRAKAISSTFASASDELAAPANVKEIALARYFCIPTGRSRTRARPT